MLFENSFLSSSVLPYKNNSRYSEKFTKNMYVCFKDLIKAFLYFINFEFSCCLGWSSSSNCPKFTKICPFLLIASTHPAFLKNTLLMFLLTMETRLKMKNRSQRYDINRHGSRHGHTYTKHMCLSIMMPIRIKQHLRNI